MTERKAGAAMALRLSADGRIAEVLADGTGTVEAGGSLRDLVDDDSRGKCSRFLEAVRTEGRASDWEMIVTVAGEPAVLSFNGERGKDDSMVVIAGSSTNDMELLFGDLIRMNDEQAGLLRAAVLELARVRRSSEDFSLEEMSRLNNELAAAQRSLATKNAQLERLNRQKQSLLGTVAHDLRNPLAIIVGYAEALIEGHAGPLSEMQERLMKRIVVSSDHMRELVEGLLDLSTIEAGSMRLERENLDLADLLREAATLNQILATRKRIDIHCDVPEAMPLLGDAGKLRQVVDNLLSNAIKYSHEETSITIEAHEEHGKARFSVADRGQGIPAEELAMIFRPFAKTSVRTTAGEKSTGLGLAIVRHIVQAHGGEIDVESAVGCGTTFTIRLPTSPAAS